MKPLPAVLSSALWRLALVIALAAPPAAALAEDDLPGRAGRLADLAGQVFLATEDRAEDWVEALRNYTVTTGDNLWVSGDGRAEIDYGGGQFRLAGDTNVHIARLDDRVLALFVAQGRVIVRLRVLGPGEAARIDTPNTQITLTRPGLYRIEVAPDRSRTDIVVREGEALAQVAAGTQQVLPGQTATLAGVEPIQAEVRTGYWVDGFDTWSADRDRRYERSRSAGYVSPQMVGYADLDEFGRWETSPDYGAIWYPTSVAVGWAPYRFGRWSWVGGWGWTWVDDAPWGYAPFHYGRWAFVGGRWGWCPGGFVVRPVWSPAMVAWYGGGGWSFSVSLGAPVYGWVPLGWGEPYIPWWRGCSDRCWTMYNRPYAVRLAERPHAPPTRYVNWSAPGGVTAVAGATFTGRQPVHRNLVDVKPQALSGVPVLARAPGVAKPTAATIPGARPRTTEAPPPASRFYRTKPMQATPATGATPGDAARPGTTAVPGEAARGAPTGTADRPPGRPGQTWVDTTRDQRRTAAPAPTARPEAAPRSPAVAAPPATRPAPAAVAPPPSTGRAPQAGADAPGTRGTPGAAARSATPPVAPRYEPRAAPPSSAAPSPRMGPAPPPQTYAPPASPAPVQRAAPPPSAAPVQRAAPPPSAPVQRSGSPPSAAPPQGAAPPPQRSGGEARGDKPAPRGEGQKPGERP